MSAELSVTGATVTYGRARAVAGATLTVRAGDLCALVGPNGAGKSSLVRFLVGAVPGEATQLTLDGEDLRGFSVAERSRLGLTLVPQGRQLFPRLTVVENLKVIADALRLDRGVVDEALDRFPILRTRHGALAGVLSGGEQQMLALARGLMCRPRILVLDEPTLGLAPVIVGELLRTIVALQDDGVGVLIVEPSMHAVPDEVAHGAVMLRGRTTLVEGHEALGDQYRALLGLDSPVEQGRPE
ncbi:ATP-binding cassette domain-containing protein [Pseudonocardia kujensis]|uniref:ABC transporter ATP-binding protein n=1 Tax=Pseudonocardia kujensis TaxID=1128675 RepID=UPI001E2E773C|nr:ATP-binding cassette domain-containing protein [Pseudonocardia kujensis]MCE0765081.1 ATP-binding cassette domain-containing protein [Pseudonocardia kujensis]